MDSMNVLFQKEFAQLRIPADRPKCCNNPSYLDDAIAKDGKMFALPQQQFVRNFLSPHTKFKRILCKHDTGTGKTNTALWTAMEFIRYYRTEYELREQENTPSVFVIGFSKQIFHRELLKRPEFGFVSKEEIAELKRLRYLSETGSSGDRSALSEYESKLKKRFGKKSWGGFFKFMGYKEFFNKLFLFSETDTEAVSSEEYILESIAAGKIGVNLELLDTFRNSLVICDEIHNVYNSLEINNYGIALRVLFNVYDIPDVMNAYVDLDGRTTGKNRIAELRNSQLRVIFLSATPVNNSPTEIVDALNLFVPQSELPNQKKLLKEDFFVDARSLKPDALKRIAELVRGRISFLRNQNPKYFPKKRIHGERIRSDFKKSGKPEYLPYLKFIRCEMSALHYHTYQNVMSEGTLPPDGQSLIDMVFPGPDEDMGLYRSKDLQYELRSSEDWKSKAEVESVSSDSGTFISGEYMQRDKLEKYCTKYTYLLDELLRNLREGSGKVLLVHQYVKMSGIMFIREMLLRNGYIEGDSGPVDSTLCVHCGERMHSHTVGKHDFLPARFLVYYGEMDATEKNRVVDRFTSADNVNGDNFRILLGSKAINEGVDLNAIQNLYVLSAPANIPTLLQILGRTIRDRSHLLLPPEKRLVNIYIVVSSIPGKRTLSYEENKYYENLMDYLVIQQLERVLNQEAMDSVLFRDVIFPVSLNKLSESEADLGTLYFDTSAAFGKKWQQICNHTRELTLKDVSLKTFNPFYSSEEISMITYIIKRLFIEQSQAWKYDDLWEAVRTPPFDIHSNTLLFQEENFTVALCNLCPEYFNQTEGAGIAQLSKMFSRLFDANDNTIVHYGVECKIFSRGKYLILLPLLNKIRSQDEYSLQMLGVHSDVLQGAPISEPDCWYRRDYVHKPLSVNITKSLRTANVSYQQMKLKFYHTYRDTSIDAIPTSVELYDLDFHVNLVEDIIRYVFHIYTDPKMKFSEMHDFYFKILYFYDRLDMILFADQVIGTKLESIYEKYIQKGGKISYGLHAKTPERKVLKEDNGYNTFLMSSMDKSNYEFNLDRLNQFLGKHPDQPSKKSDKPDKKPKTHNLKKVFAYLLPIGHFLTGNADSNQIQQASIPKIYIPLSESERTTNPKSETPEVWKRAIEFLPEPETGEVENDNIIGYYEKNPIGIDLKFKLRPPVHKIVQHEDSRMIERGSACNTRHKEDLENIARSLGLSVTSDMGIKELCNSIKLELMRLEMDSRRKWNHLSREEKYKHKRIRYFYLHFEAQQS